MKAKFTKAEGETEAAVIELENEITVAEAEVEAVSEKIDAEENWQVAEEYDQYGEWQ